MGALPVTATFEFLAQPSNVFFFKILLEATCLLHIARFAGVCQKEFRLCKKKNQPGAHLICVSRQLQATAHGQISVNRLALTVV